jgi:hypothetical protein
MLARLARPHAAEAIRRLAGMVESGDYPPSVRVAAARVLLDLANPRSPKAARRGGRSDAAGVIEKVVEIDWGHEAGP